MMISNITIADPSPKVRCRLQRIFESRVGTNCALAEDGPALARILAKAPPGLLVLNPSLPAINGPHVFETLSRNSPPALVLLGPLTPTPFPFLPHGRRQLASPILLGMDATAEEILEALKLAGLQVDRLPPTSLRSILARSLASILDPALPYDRLVIRAKLGFDVVPICNVVRLKAADNYVEIHTPGGTHLVRSRFHVLGARLPPGEFIQIGRSTLVRISRIRRIRPRAHGDFFVELADGTLLRGARTHRSAVMSLFTAGSQDRGAGQISH